NNEGGVPHVWTGLCPAGCAVVLRHRESYADLTGKARVRWYTKTSGFHQIRPIVKLADGTFLVGDHADAYTFDFRESEFYFGDLRWLKLDIEKVQTKGTLLDKVDLTKVDEIGFVDLTPGSGHGQGGYSEVGPAIAFDQMHLAAVRLAGGIQPGLVVETDGIDNERVAFPAADGLAGPAFGFEIQIMLAAIEEESAVAVCVAFPQEREGLGT